MLGWFAQLVFTATFISYIFLTGRWDWISYYFKFIWVVLFFFGAYFSYIKSRNHPFFLRKSSKEWFLVLSFLVLICIFSGLNYSAIKGRFFNVKAINLSFPLKNGTYYVGQGGNHPIVNYHNSYPPQKYALDIVKLNTFGTRARGIYPKELTKYEIYDDTLYSPCNGKVIKAVGYLSNMIPPAMDKDNPPGNYIAMDYDSATIYLAHMQKDSLLVKEGDFVKKGQPIGKVGNSGNTTEPHLHIHAEKNGYGIPIIFNGRFLKRNDLF